MKSSVRFIARRGPFVFSIGLIWACCLALLAWIAAGWLWSVTAPARTALPIAENVDPVAAAHAISARHLMGVSPRSGTAKENALPALRLVGAMTAGGGRAGFGVFVEPGKPARAVLEGEELQPGVRLVRIEPDRAVIRYGGVTQSIPLVSASANARTKP